MNFARLYLKYLMQWGSVFVVFLPPAIVGLLLVVDLFVDMNDTPGNLVGWFKFYLMIAALMALLTPFLALIVPLQVVWIGLRARLPFGKVLDISSDNVTEFCWTWNQPDEGWSREQVREKLIEILDREVK